MKTKKLTFSILDTIKINPLFTRCQSVMSGKHAAHTYMYTYMVILTQCINITQFSGEVGASRRSVTALFQACLFISYYITIDYKKDLKLARFLLYTLRAYECCEAQELALQDVLFYWRCVMKTLTVYRPNTAPFDFEDAFGAFDRDSRGCGSFAQVNRLMDSLFGLAGQPLTASLVRLPCVDVEETDKNYLLEAELPGFTMDDIAVNLDNGMITIESKKTDAAEKQDPKKNYVLRERKSRYFSRSFKLPENADPESINAAFKNGLLTLTIGKRTEAQKKTIQIEG